LRSSTRETSLIDQKLERATEGIEPYFLEHLKTKISRENGLVISEYISSMRIETNLSDKYRRGVITSLKLLSEFSNNKYFIDMTKEDVLSYLDHLRKPDESDYIGMKLNGETNFEFAYTNDQQFIEYIRKRTQRAPKINDTAYYPYFENGK
jgi:hypothetical protein